MATSSTFTRRDKCESGLKRVITFGLFCLIAGMAVLPTDGHVYDRVVIVIFALPTLLLVVIRPSSVQKLWRQPIAKWIVLLLAWSMLSLLWSDDGGASNWIGRCLGILLFLYAWIRVFEGKAQQVYWFLFACCVVMALGAVTMIVLQQTPYFHELLTYRGSRLQGIGVLGHPNLAATAMSAAVIWLCTFPSNRLWQHTARALMIGIFLLFIAMTVSRSAWGGLFLALLIITACQGGRHARWLLATLFGLGILATILFLPELLERGWSARPGILEHSWALFLQHPWIGVGQATPVHLYLPTFMAYHAHNMFNQLAIQLGLPALIVWLGVWLSVGMKGWSHRQKPMGRIILASWVFIAFTAQFQLSFLISSPRVEWLMTWLPLAMCFSLEMDKIAHRTTGINADGAA